MPTFDIGSILGGLFSGIFGLAGQKQTNETNMKIAEMNQQSVRESNKTNLQIQREVNNLNYKMNAENNQLQVDLAEKAYQRSTQSNQVAELVRAGLTEQQALQVVAGSGSPATMPMPTTTPAVAESTTVQPETLNYQEQQSPLSASAQGFGESAGAALGGAASLMAQYVEDCKNPDGGFFGQKNILPLKSLVYDLVNQGKIKIDSLYGCTPSEFQSKIRNAVVSPDNDAEYRNFAEMQFFDSAEWRKVLTDVPTQHAFESFVRSLTTDGTNASRFRQEVNNETLQYWRNVSAQFDGTIAQFKLDAMDDYTSANGDSYKATFIKNFGFANDIEFNTARINLNKTFQQMLESDSDAWKESVRQEFLYNQHAVKFLAMLDAARNEGMFNAIDSDFGQALYGYFNMAKECGLLDTLTGTVGKVFDVVAGRFTYLLEKGVDTIFNAIEKANTTQGKHRTTTVHVDSKGSRSSSTTISEIIE